MNAAVLWSSEMTEDKAWDFVQYYHDKGWLLDMFKNGLTPKEALEDLSEKEDDVRFLKWFK